MCHWSDREALPMKRGCAPWKKELKFIPKDMDHVGTTKKAKGEGRRWKERKKEGKKENGIGKGEESN